MRRVLKRAFPLLSWHRSQPKPKEKHETKKKKRKIQSETLRNVSVQILWDRLRTSILMLLCLILFWRPHKLRLKVPLLLRRPVWFPWQPLSSLRLRISSSSSSCNFLAISCLTHLFKFLHYENQSIFKQNNSQFYFCSPVGFVCTKIYSISFSVLL